MSSSHELRVERQLWIRTAGLEGNISVRTTLLEISSPPQEARKPPSHPTARNCWILWCTQESCSAPKGSAQLESCPIRYEPLSIIRVVIVLYQRAGPVRTMPITTVDKATLHELIHKSVAPTATVCTDELLTIRSLPMKHEALCHNAGEYVNGNASTNGTESFWARLKRAWMGIHQWWSHRPTWQSMRNLHNTRD